MSDVVVLIPIETIRKLRVKVNGTDNPDELDDQAIVLWVLENYLDGN